MLAHSIYSASGPGECSTRASLRTHHELLLLKARACVVIILDTSEANERGTFPTKEQTKAQNEAIHFAFCCADVDRCVFE
jgi:hypothetical protein